MNFSRATEYKLLEVFPDIAVRWRRVANDLYNLHRMEIKVTDGLRDFSKQYELYAKGRIREKNGIWTVVDPTKVVTYAKPGSSYHQYGLAVDTCFTGSDPYLLKMRPEESDFYWAEFGRFVVAHGLKWGGEFKTPDRPHSELGYGMKVTYIQEIYEYGGLRAVWMKCNQILTKWGGV